eukprot:TRINITY_DN9101_c0_g2_i1.p1 TRINITY_DN9101_c0_g2~~TRINITY_DN9101_c0_g2_i1.p1  ORF type:complete len:389 (+),score=66.15 TRINITY_DN9101_c0_g2_i1:70-1167(+)
MAIEFEVKMKGQGPIVFHSHSVLVFSNDPVKSENFVIILNGPRFGHGYEMNPCKGDVLGKKTRKDRPTSTFHVDITDFCLGIKSYVPPPSPFQVAIETPNPHGAHIESQPEVTPSESRSSTHYTTDNLQTQEGEESENSGYQLVRHQDVEQIQSSLESTDETFQHPDERNSVFNERLRANTFQHYQIANTPAKRQKMTCFSSCQTNESQCLPGIQTIQIEPSHFHQHVNSFSQQHLYDNQAHYDQQGNFDNMETSEPQVIVNVSSSNTTQKQPTQENEDEFIADEQAITYFEQKSGHNHQNDSTPIVDTQASMMNQGQPEPELRQVEADKDFDTNQFFNLEYFDDISGHVNDDPQNASNKQLLEN